ncbi:PglZ domain-containing protein [Aliiglaciecola sp. SL4]|uniref:PglZ domain-containing protein n=1 Tax=Aliiglaciecola sp. SL4 TaxID=3239806 RepID=UPI00355C52C6
MIDLWLKEDLEEIFSKNIVAVFIDEHTDAEFILEILNKTFKVHQANSEIEELHVKYLIEKEQPSATKHVIYTNLVKDDLKYIREYCEVNGCLDIRHLENYIKGKVHKALNLNINMPKDELITAAKVSIGKDLTYWMDLCHKGASEIFDLEKELLPFIHDPALFTKKYDEQLLTTFYQKVNELLGQEYIKKPAQTLADEIVAKMFDGLACNDCAPILESVYVHWLNSKEHEGSFDKYLANYLSKNSNSNAFDSNQDIWNINVAHPFKLIDEQWLKAIGKDINNKALIPNHLARITQRDQSKQAQSLNITFWADVKVLLEFDDKDIGYLSTREECIEFYTKHFFKLDTAIRNLYTEFLNTPEILAPYQDYYKHLVDVFFDKWFKYLEGYQENQTGILQRIIDDNSQKIAIIVGDGVAYELAYEVSKRVSDNFKFTNDIIMADLPSLTVNNMSRIYMANGMIDKVQKKRETYLTKQNPSSDIDYVLLDDVNNEALSGQYLICTYKDIDDMGDKLNNKALKFFPQAVETFTNKITTLLNSGYQKVFLITDHGFVLTGMLSEADKITPSLNGQNYVAERYIRTVDKQQSLDSYVEIEKQYEEFNYHYFSKTMNPFKTPSVYGFAHGGAAPQELITPYFCWERTAETGGSLNAKFTNKADLKNVSGELYLLKIKADDSEDNIFEMERKVYLVKFCDSKPIGKSDVFTLKRGETTTKEFTFDCNNEIEVQLLDALTKEQLDKAVVKKNNDRDLGGLF